MSASFVLDCSVAMSWCFSDEISLVTDRLLDVLASGSQACVPPVWLLEVSNVLLVAERKKRIPERESIRFMALLRTLPIVVDNDCSLLTTDRIMRFGRETGLSSYDASYLELADRLGVSLATLDKPLKKAAQKLRIPIIG